MYNINYTYLSNHSDIIVQTRAFGSYDWKYKLRTSEGARGSQLIWYGTAKGQTRFLLSCAYTHWNFYIGWNVSKTGRFTIANKVLI